MMLLSVYVKDCDRKTKCTYFLIKDDYILMIYIMNILFGIKLALILKKNLRANLYRQQKVLKTKTRSYDYKVTDFRDEEVPKIYSNCTYLAVKLLDSILKRNEDYHWQVF